MSARRSKRDDGYPPNMRIEDLLADVSCNFCRHRFVGRLGCRAFPDGNIPRAILSGEHRHLEPVPGDNGITFESLPAS